MAALQKRLPHLARHDPETAGLARKIVAADGSWFNLAGEVVHALHCARGNAGTQSRVRLNLQLDVDSFCPTDFDVSGDGDGNEAAAFMRQLRGDRIYLVDRNFVGFAFVNAVLDKGSNLVLRLKAGVNVDVTRARELTEKDAAHGVLRDEVGVLPGPTSAGNADARSCTSGPPDRPLRRVTVWDAEKRSEVWLLTDLLDVPAYVVGTLYRLRWQVELFFRWLKVLAGFRHLVSQSARGVTTQFYVAVLVALLVHVRTRARVGKYGLLWVGWVAAGRATPAAMAEALARLERERANAARRRLAKTKPA